jgi:glycosyltransferase involved in cell wall biosynthesis
LFDRGHTKPGLNPMETDIPFNVVGGAVPRGGCALANRTMQLLEYCRSEQWAGHDPYDALNSQWLELLPILDHRVPRLVMTQVLKRSPFNLRHFLRIPKTENPKALALFLSSVVKLQNIGLVEGSGLTTELVEKIMQLRSRNASHWCWGYSFPWQTRTVLVPRGTPNLVCTTFVARALLDAYEANGDSRLLEMARSAAEYLLDELYWTEGEFEAGFNYPLPSVRARVHNANFLAASLLCRIFRHTNDSKFVELALRAARYSASRQREDGSWHYGEHRNQRWIDNFHTGYNLCALRTIGRCLETPEFNAHVRRGFEFYREHFIRADGRPGYFHNRAYPIDIHSVAQSILTLIEFRDLHSGNVELANRVCDWACKHLRDESGYFYYRLLPFCTNKISYMRWSQAWMLLALATLLESRKDPMKMSEPAEGMADSFGAPHFEAGALASAGTERRLPSYVLVTPARNEAAFIELTLASVTRQTARPLKWVIVSDGSTDDTDDIVRRYASAHDWIELVRMPERKERHFAGKVNAFNAGYDRVKDMDFDLIGSLDADVSFAEDYFAFLLERFLANPRLGLAGTPFKEGDFSYDYRFVSIQHVSGACQLFRRECFKEIGGYRPVKGGGIDHIAVLTARLKGWQTRTFTEKFCRHHRKIGSAERGVLSAKFGVGKLDYALGAHPLWELFRSAYQMTKKPYVIGGAMILSGYLWSLMRRADRPVTDELVRFRRHEQIQRLTAFLTRRRTLADSQPEPLSNQPHSCRTR